MTWQHIDRKLREQAEKRIGAAAVQRVADRTARIEQETDLRAFSELLSGRNH